MLVTATATDPLGLSATDTLDVPDGAATGVRTIRTSFLGTRVNWGSVVDAGINGPNLTLDDVLQAPVGPVTLGASFHVLTTATTPGMRVYKHPLAAGTVTFGVWNAAGTLLASTIQTWEEDDGGWVDVDLGSSVARVSEENYHWGYHYPNNDTHYAASTWVFNAQDSVVWPLRMPTFV